jgi:hypothetical protein
LVFAFYEFLNHFIKASLFMAYTSAVAPKNNAGEIKSEISFLSRQPKQKKALALFLTFCGK